ncbi:Uncharacterised protein [uncultured Clostridium sp.]|nr:Uncharacterised protein [uncultured Clostridium sp.]
MKAPVGLLSDRTVLRSKMEGPRPDKFQFGELKKRNFPIKTYKLLTIKLLYSMFLINYYIGAFVWK